MLPITLSYRWLICSFATTNLLLIPPNVFLILVIGFFSSGWFLLIFFYLIDEVLAEFISSFPKLGDHLYDHTLDQVDAYLRVV